jgi:hypothetical protein
MANYLIDDKQFMLACYVDDTNISHVDPKVVTMILVMMEALFDNMTVTRGKEQTFLGMNVRFVRDRALVSMKSYLVESIAESGHSIAREAATPAKENPSWC